MSVRDFVPPNDDDLLARLAGALRDDSAVPPPSGLAALRGAVAIQFPGAGQEGSAPPAGASGGEPPARGAGADPAETSTVAGAAAAAPAAGAAPVVRLERYRQPKWVVIGVAACVVVFTLGLVWYGSRGTTPTNTAVARVRDDTAALRTDLQRHTPPPQTERAVELLASRFEQLAPSQRPQLGQAPAEVIAQACIVLGVPPHGPPAADVPAQVITACVTVAALPDPTSRTPAGRPLPASAG